jgi:hypothetical protein
VATVRATGVYSPQTRVTVAYSAATGTWSVAQNGSLTPGAAPANVILQRVPVRPSRFTDVRGQATPYTVTTGSGPVTVLRDGKRYTGTWKRTGFGPTHFVDAAGRDILLRPGPTWVLLVPNSGSISFG